MNDLGLSWVMRLVLQLWMIMMRRQCPSMTKLTKKWRICIQLLLTSTEEFLKVQSID